MGRIIGIFIVYMEKNIILMEARKILRVRLFSSEDFIASHADLPNKRAAVINSAMNQYQAWMGRNIARNIDIVDIVTDNYTTPAGEGGWHPFACCVITVKYIGDDIP